MAEISFYHLQYSSAPTAITRLLHKAQERGMSSVLLCEKDEDVVQMDELLWTHVTDAFLPHATDQDDKPDQQPVLITSSTERVDNNAQLLVIKGKNQPLEPDYLNRFSKVMDVFDGANDHDVKDARKRWAIYKKQGYSMSYWKQNKNGGWQQG